MCVEAPSTSTPAVRTRARSSTTSAAQSWRRRTRLDTGLADSSPWGSLPTGGSQESERVERPTPTRNTLTAPGGADRRVDDGREVGVIHVAVKSCRTDGAGRLSRQVLVETPVKRKRQVGGMQAQAHTALPHRPRAHPPQEIGPVLPRGQRWATGQVIGSVMLRQSSKGGSHGGMRA